MLILKGEQGKSRVVEALSQVESVFTYVYYDERVPFGNLYINSDEVSLRSFISSLKDQSKDSQSDSCNVDYVVIYTNLVEAALFDLISWIKENESDFNCKQVIITCK